MSDDVELKGIISLVGVPEGVRGLKTIADSADTAEDALDKVKAASKAAGDSVKKAGKEAKEAGEDLTKAGKGAKDAEEGLDRVAKSSRRAKEGIDGVKTSSEKTSTTLGETDKKTRTTATGMEQLRRQFDQTGTSMRSAGRTLTTHVSVPLTAIAGLSFHSFSTFDKTIRQVGSVADISGRQLDSMRADALRLGKDTAFSANEAATAMLELAKGGISQAQMGAGVLENTLTLASAGGLELGESAKYMTNTLNAFGLGAKGAAGVAAALAGGANASTASVQSLGLGLSQVGMSATNASMSMNETIAVLAMLDDQGVKGSDGGTSLKSMLNSLTPATNEAADAIKKYHLEFKNSNGTFRSAAEIADDLQQKMGKLGEVERATALETIFGSDGIRAATAMMKGGADTVVDYTAKTKDMAAAVDLARTNTEGAAGQIEQAKGSIETAAIKLGQELAPKALAAAHGAERLADGFSDMSSSSQNAVVSLGVMAAAGGPALMALGSMASGASTAAGGVRKLGAGFRTLGIASGLVSGSTGAATLGLAGMSATLVPLAILLGGAGVAMYAYERHTKNQAKADEEWRQRGLQLAPLIAERKDAVDGLSAAQARVRDTTARMKAVEDESGRGSAAYAAARAQVAAAHERAAAAAERVRNAEKAVAENEGIGDGKGNADGSATGGENAAQNLALAQSIEKLNQATDARTNANRRLNFALNANLKGVDGIAMDTAASKAGEATRELDKLNKAARDGKITYQEAGEQSKKWARQLEDANRQMSELSDAAGKSDASLAKLKSQVIAAAGAMPKLNPAMAHQLAEALGMAGMSADQVRAKIQSMAATRPNLAVAKILLSEMSKGERIATFGTDNINTILGRIGTASVSTTTWTSFDQMMKRMRANSTVTVNVKYNQGNPPKLGGGGTSITGNPGNPMRPIKKADGGIMRGPGTGTSDSIGPVYVSNGEGIIPESSTSVNRALVEWMIDNPGKRVQLPGFAKGKKPFGPADTNKDGKTSAKEKAAFQASLATGSASAIDAATKEVSDLPEDIRARQNAAILGLKNQITKEAAATNNKAAAKKALEAAAARAKSLQAAYDKISGKNADARRKAARPALDKANGAVDKAQKTYDNIVDTLRDGPAKRKDFASQIVGYAGQLKSQDDDAKREQEDIRREALGLESVDDEKHRAAVNAVRAANGLALLERGDTLNDDGTITKASAAADSPDLAAQLAQAQQRAQIAEGNQRISDQALTALGSSGDIGVGGFGNALQAASGGAPAIHFHSTVPATVQQMQQVADMALGGGQYNGLAAQAYSPVQQIGA